MAANIMFTSMKAFEVLILLSLANLFQCQELHIKHSPPYIVLQSQSSEPPVASSDLPNVLAVPLGLSHKPNSVLQSTSVLRRPKANVLITVVTSKNSPLALDSLASFPLDWDVPFVDTENLMNSVQSRFLDQDPLMLDLVSSNQFFDIKSSHSIFESLPSTLASMRDRFLEADSIFNALGAPVTLSSLNTSLTADGGLLAELQMMKDVVSKLKSHKSSSKTPDVLCLTLHGLKEVEEKHGADSSQTKEAVDMLKEHIDEMTSTLRDHYKDNVMVEVLTVPEMERPKVRKTRSLMDVVANTDFPKLNLEIEYYSDFPVTFNIVLWLMVILSLCVFFVAYGIWNMNPNLESILYRVPQDELKKTN